MKKGLLILSVLSFSLVSTADVVADDVVVDLSVLGEIATDNSAGYYSYQETYQPSSGSSILNLPALEPQFPVVTPKEEKVIVDKPVTAEKKVSNKKTILKKNIKKIEIKKVDVKPEIKKEEPKLDVKKEEIKESVSEIKKEEPKEESKVIEEEKPISLEVVKPEEILKDFNIKEPVETNVDSHINDSEKLSSEEAMAKSDVVVEVLNSGNIKVTEVLSEKAKAPSNLVVFSNDEIELTEEHKMQLSHLISSFEKPGKTRINIFSYNVDGGEDVFKRKRQSLTRATEVRHFLISYGYKNFNIKVVNIDENSDKINSVEVSEVK